MSDKKPETKKPEQQQRQQSIPVLVMRFMTPTDLPGKPGASSVKAEKQVNKPQYTLAYHPWMRHFQVTYKRFEEPAQSIYVHESQLQSWTMLEEEEKPKAEEPRAEATG